MNNKYPWRIVLQVSNTTHKLSFESLEEAIKAKDEWFSVIKTVQIGQWFIFRFSKYPNISFRADVIYSVCIEKNVATDTDRILELQKGFLEKQVEDELWKGQQENDE